GLGGWSTCIASWSGWTSEPQQTASEAWLRRPVWRFGIFSSTRAARIRRRNTTSRSTSRPFERHTALTLIGPRALLVRLRRRRLQRQEYDLDEPFADRTLQDI